MNQEDAAGVVGKRRQAYALWEKGDTRPDVDDLDRLWGRGFDLIYLMTGERSADALDDSESQLITDFRSLDERARRMLRAMLDAWHGWAPRSDAISPAEAASYAKGHFAREQGVHEVEIEAAIPDGDDEDGAQETRPRAGALPGERVASPVRRLKRPSKS